MLDNSGTVSIDIDTTFTDPVAELLAQGLIITETQSSFIVPRPTEQFYNELEHLVKTTEFRSLDLGLAVRMIISKYEPCDLEMYSTYMLVAMANDCRWIWWLDKSINPAMMLQEDVTFQRILAELQSRKSSK